MSDGKLITKHDTHHWALLMNTMADRIYTALTAQFAPASLTVTDDSAKHAGHTGARAGGDSHFTVAIVSEAFRGMSRVARHRAVYAVCQPFFDEGLHALAIDAQAE